MTKREIFSSVAKRLGKTAGIIAYIAAAASVMLAAAAIVSEFTGGLKDFKKGESAVFFGTLALYSVFGFPLLKTSEKILSDMSAEKTPFSTKSEKLLFQTAIWIFVISVVPAAVGNISTGIIGDVFSYEPTISFNFGYWGVITGILLLFFSLAFGYGHTLEDKF